MPFLLLYISAEFEMPLSDLPFSSLILQFVLFLFLLISLDRGLSIRLAILEKQILALLMLSVICFYSLLISTLCYFLFLFWIHLSILSVNS